MNDLQYQQSLAMVQQMLSNRQVEQAYQLLQTLHKENPTDLVVLTHVVGILLTRQNIQDANVFIGKLLALSEKLTDINHAVHLINLFITHHRYNDAVTLAKGLPRKLRMEPNVLLACGNAALQARALDIAVDWLDTYPDLVRTSVKLSLMKASIASMQGRFEQAVEYYQIVLAMQPDNSFAVAGLAKCQRIDRAMREVLLAAPESQTEPDARARVLYAKAKAENDCGNYSAAWELASIANQLKKQRSTFDADSLRQQVDHLLHTFTPERVKQAQSSNETQHVFVVGMPRSGTTLVEQILSVVDGFYAGGETPAVDYALSFTRAKSHYTQAMLNGEALDWENACLAYERYYSCFNNFSGDRVINKVPTNFFHVGLIKLMFPNAKVINMQRSPLDVAVSIYFENFSHYFAYTNDLKDIFFVIDQYKRLMEHWHGVFGNDILDVSYQSLVSDYSQGIKDIGGFLNIDLLSQQNASSAQNHVETPSVWQVRQPINTNAVNRWQRYAQFLDEYIERYS
ncbi:tetratricopeptide repeat-containing sulfotransferase family protein [Alteromonas facilis]|uniref:tetratricopeptide repeat-containing sulfotransferase family protein n=1 Tax=Alteromonas facilis TaxID=2048004 RepID=UPI000C28CF13|nr:sulfotransferase [Alteromonas facilis]